MTYNARKQIIDWSRSSIYFASARPRSRTITRTHLHVYNCIVCIHMPALHRGQTASQCGIPLDNRLLDWVTRPITFESTTALTLTLTLIPTAFKMSSFPQGGGADPAPPKVTIVDGLPYSPNYTWPNYIMSQTCAKCFCINKIRFVAFATTIDSYAMCELRQNSVHFMKKSHV